MARLNCQRPAVLVGKPVIKGTSGTKTPSAGAQDKPYGFHGRHSRRLISMRQIATRQFVPFPTPNNFHSIPPVLTARQFRLRLGLCLFCQELLSQSTRKKGRLSGVRQTFIICNQSASHTRRHRLQRIPTKGLPGAPPDFGVNGHFLSQLRGSRQPIWQSKTVLCRGGGGAYCHSRFIGSCRAL